MSPSCRSTRSSIIAGAWTLAVGDHFRDVDDHPRAVPILERHFADGAAGSPEVLFAVQVGGEVEAALAVGVVAPEAEVEASDPLGVLELERLVVGQLRSLEGERQGEVEHLGRAHRGEEIVVAHAVAGFAGSWR